MGVQQYIDAIAPTLATQTSRIAVFLPLATQQTSRAAFGDNYEYAIALRVCHLLARNPVTTGMTGGAAGAVNSETEGEISRSYTISPHLLKKFGDLASTSYGAELCSLIDGNITGHRVSSDVQSLDGSTLLQGEFI